MNKKVIPVVFIIAGAAAYGFIRWRNLETKFYYAGTVEATKVDIPARLATVIQTMELKEGDKIKQGEKLATLACDDLRIQSNLANSKLARAVLLRKSGTLPQDAYDEFASRKEELDLKLGWCNVLAPNDGTVLTRYREPGEWVGPGTKLYTIANLREAWIYIYVPEPIMAKLKVGSTVDSYLPDQGMKQLKGQIIKVNEEAEFTPKNVQTREERTRLVYGVKILFNNENGLLKPGMPIEIDLPE